MESRVLVKQSYLTETLGCNLVTYLGYGSLGFTGALVTEWKVIVTSLTNFTAPTRHIRFTTENKIEYGFTMAKYEE